MGSDNAVERPTGRAQGIHPFFNGRVIQKKRGMVWFDARVDDKRPLASPVFAADGGADPVYVQGGIGAGEGDPEKIVQGPGSKFTVIDDDYQWEWGWRISSGECRAEGRHIRIVASPAVRAGRPLDGEHPRQADTGFAETVGKLKV